MTQNIEQWMKDAAEAILNECVPAQVDRAAEIIASHVPSDLNEAIAALDACVGCLMIQGFPADHPDVKHAYGIVLKHQAMKPSEAAAQQPTKRQQIDALVKAEYEDGLYDRLPEIEHNRYPGHIFRLRFPTFLGVAFDRKSFRLYLFGKQVINWNAR